MHYICRYTVEYRGIIVKCVWMFLLTIYIEYVKQWACFNRGPWVNKRTELCIYKDIYATWNYHRLYCYMFFFQKLCKSKGFGASFLTCASWWNYFWQYMLQGSKLLDPIWKPLNLLDWNLTRELRSEYWEILLFFSAWEIKSNHISFNGSPREIVTDLELGSHIWQKKQRTILSMMIGGFQHLAVYIWPKDEIGP